MERLCVFCGQKPERKNNEHVIPLWLIELTGNPNRIGQFGDKKFLSPKSGKRTFSFDSLKFPSCESCNTKFSELEGYGKSTIERLLRQDSIAAMEFNNLLDWFDKIRVGLWLGFRYLQHDPAGIKPHFHIEQRLRQADRMLVIFRGDGTHKGLNFMGCEQLSFLYTPSCFGLRINNYCFINISCFGLIDRRLGFPYIAYPMMRIDGGIQGQYVYGRNRIMNPLLKKRIYIEGTELYQPIFPFGVNNPNTRKYFETDYVRQNSIVWEEGIGKVFINTKSNLQAYPLNRSKMWIPKQTYHFERLMYEVQLLSIEWQSYVDDLRPSLKLLPPQQKQQMTSQLILSKKFNRKVTDVLRRQVDKLELPPLSTSNYS